MKKAILLIAISIVLVSSMMGQSASIDSRHSQNQLFCPPTSVGNRVFIHKYSSNNNTDLPGYMQLNAYNCTSTIFQPDLDAPKVSRKKNGRM
ncbi:MAG TPA: hypothetical protein VMZ26_17745 [Pyrinomonadaceae bacterium]|nr:hypothetical protein [Pyrinomonadaceae bacterium]